MGCNCGNTTIVHEVSLPDGTVKRFLTEGAARSFAQANNGVYAQVVR